MKLKEAYLKEGILASANDFKNRAEEHLSGEEDRETEIRVWFYKNYNMGKIDRIFKDIQDKSKKEKWDKKIVDLLQKIAKDTISNRVYGSKIKVKDAFDQFINNKPVEVG